MHTWQSQGIKEIINDFPSVASILQDYGIECGTCTVGICQLKDVLEIHSLPEEQAHSLMERIESVLSDDSHSSGTITKSTLKPSPSEAIALSGAISTLMREHTFIQQFISIAPYLTEKLDLTKSSDQKFANKCLEFITCYADRHHHGKEEDVLFSYFDTTEEIFQVMLEEHVQGRTLVGLMRNNILNRETNDFTAHFLKYHDLIKEHIKKEDTILFPWLDRKLTGKQKQELQYRFEQSDGESSIDDKKFEDFVEKLEGDILCESVTE